MNTPLVIQAFERALIRPACSPNGADNEAWLQDKIKHYESEVQRLEAQLKHAKILLKGHQTWLQDVQRRKGAK